MVRSASASEILVASFVCAAATAQCIRTLAADTVSFVITGGDEDAACADYIEALLLSPNPNASAFTNRVRQSSHGRRFVESSSGVFPVEDLDECCRVDHFRFAMRVARENRLLVLRREEKTKMVFS